MTHLELTPQERTQLDGRWHGIRAPLCGTGDGHYVGVAPADYKGPAPAVTCPACLARLSDKYTARALGIHNTKETLT